MTAKPYFSLSRAQVVNKARGYGQLRDTLVNVLRDAPMKKAGFIGDRDWNCLLYTSPSPRDKRQSRMPSSA